jgi:hypothetical protein
MLRHWVADETFRSSKGPLLSMCVRILSHAIQQRTARMLHAVLYRVFHNVLRDYKHL